jgi:hypothetical protein
LSKELTPEQKRSIEISSELRSLNRKIVELQKEQWALEGYPPLTVIVTYDDGEKNISEPFLYTEEQENRASFFSPDIEGRFKLPLTVLKAKSIV